MSRSEGAQYASGEEWRAITNSSRKNEEVGPKESGTFIPFSPPSAAEGSGESPRPTNVPN